MPGVEKSAISADFTIPIDAFWWAGIVREDEAVTFGPVGGVPVATPVFLSFPASTSAWVVVYVAVQVSLAATARVDAGQLTADSPGIPSVTPTEVSVTLPILVTT